MRELEEDEHPVNVWLLFIRRVTPGCFEHDAGCRRQAKSCEKERMTNVQ
jgi:hypothetical protein